MPQETSPRRRENGDKLSFLENLGFGLGDMASNLFFQTFSIFLFYYYTDVFGIAPAVVGTMFFVVRFFDAANDPIMGVIADRTQTRWGKYRPYLLWMAIPYGFCGYLIFANPDLGPTGKIVYATATYVLMLVAYTAINVPYSSLMGVISPSSQARTLASTYRFVCAFGGGLLISLLVRPLVKELGGDDEVAGFQYTMAIFAGLSILLFWTTFATTKERVQPPKGQVNNIRGEIGELFRNKPWIILFVAAMFSTTFIIMRNSVTIHYFKYVAGTGDDLFIWIFDKSTFFLSSSMFMMMMGVLAMGFVVRRFDKRTLSIVLTFTTAACLVAFYFIPASNYGLMLAVNALAAFTMGPTSALVWAMYGDVADYGEYTFGRRSTGLIHSATLFALKTGSMIAGTLAGWVLGSFGFVANEQQSESSLLGISLMFSVIPALFAVGKGIALVCYPLNRAKVAEIEIALAERKTLA
ncbi:MFS transporter [Pelagicoccus sp. SDUM812002]|uniref:MFS transporter n=1 Tax=Pelagicoccus sp. SDUM812002 TaxID=3041266 RepID=UPI00280E7F92|nr:MFS transporter [Pelagicoccus sp. SDUM812002]MDQ8185764.1 MFS transporter [Pelagicoccus sp. SDUM812002]